MRIKVFILSIIFLPFFCISQIAPKAKKTDKKPSFGTLFKSKDTLKFIITTNMKRLMKDRGLKPIYHSAKVNFITVKGKNMELPITLKVRGNFRKSPENCVFPPLLLNFNKKNDGNSVFNKQNKLKLITHCIKKDYIVREELVYRIFNLLSENSFKSRLASVIYVDSANGKKPAPRPAFLIEEETILAKRIGRKTYTNVRLRQNQLDTLSMATIAVFEFMIGNTDWSVPYRHNIKLFYKDGVLPMPVPYDFDHSGLVNAHYANPAEELKLSSVKERLYRGINYPPHIFKAVIEKFNLIKPDLMQLYEQNNGLDAPYRKYAVNYLNEFYEIINSEKKFQRQIVDQGIKNDYGGVVIKGLNN